VPVLGEGIRTGSKGDQSLWIAALFPDTDLSMGEPLADLGDLATSQQGTSDSRTQEVDGEIARYRHRLETDLRENGVPERHVGDAEDRRAGDDPPGAHVCRIKRPAGNGHAVAKFDAREPHCSGQWEGIGNHLVELLWSEIHATEYMDRATVGYCLFMVVMDAAERRRRLAVRHFLAAPGPNVVDVARDLGGMHSTDPTTVYLSARARLSGFCREELEAALYEERSLVRVLGMRRTLFVVPAEMEVALRQGCALKYLAAERRRLVTLLMDQHRLDEEWLEGVLARTRNALMELGEAGATELTELVPELGKKLSFGEGKKWGGQFGLSTRVFFLLATSGEIIRARPRGTWVSGQYRWSPRRSWLTDESTEMTPPESRTLLARRWLRGFGPGSFDDLKWWSGWGVRDTRDALAAVGAVEVQLDDATGYVLPDDLGLTAPVAPWAALLPGLDPTPMGWKDRDWYLGAHRHELFDRSGNIGPSVWLNGRIVGGWTQHEDGDIGVGLLETVTTDEMSLIEAQAASLQTWLEGDVVTPRFRTPLESRLGKQPR